MTGRAPRFIDLDGRRYLWRDLVKLRQEQRETARRAEQPPLFELREDCRPATDRTAAGRCLDHPHMRRREFLAMIGGAAALTPFGATAQPRLPVIGYLSSRSAEVETPLRVGILDGLEQRGFVVGRNVAIEYRFAEGNFDPLPSLAAELVGLPAALLVATGAPAAIAAKKATATIPLVFTSGGDPVASGLVDSLARPGGNATGTHSFGVDLFPKRLELLREILPQPGLIAFLVGPQTPGTPAMLRQVETAAQAVGQPILVVHGRDEDEIEKAFVTMAERQARGLLYAGSEYFQVIADKLVALAARYRIPASYEWREFVAAGGLMSYSTRRGETMRLAGDYAGRILKGRLYVQNGGTMIGAWPSQPHR